MIAIYARQSVDKKDSISIDGQIDRCKIEAGDEECKIFVDKGFSGKNTERPKFKEMFSEIRAGIITKIIVYKIDRISRAIVDFGKIMEELDKYKVEFVSCTEKFDTSSPIGRAMLNIIMVFAQLERETIQQRVKDNYYQRGEQGFYLGGRAPFGYSKVEAVLNGKKTYTFEINLDQAEIVTELFDKYANKNETLGQLVKWLNQNSVKTNSNNSWSSVSVGRLLRNPVYVQANADVYMYLKLRGATMNNEIDDYVGENGCYVYAPRKDITTSKFTDLSKSFITLGLHKGIIYPDQWLTCQFKLDDNKQIKNSGKGTHTHYSGRLKCGYCKLAVNVVNNNRGHSYINCGGRKLKYCYDRKKTIRLEEIESKIDKALFAFLRKHKYKSTKGVDGDSYKINQLKIQLAQIDIKISELIDGISESNEITVEYLNKAIPKLDAERKRLNNDIFRESAAQKTKPYSNDEIDFYINNWNNNITIEEKKSFVSTFIEKAYIYDDRIDVIFYDV